jgi:hypothetical protein
VFKPTDSTSKCELLDYEHIYSERRDFHYNSVAVLNISLTRLLAASSIVLLFLNNLCLRRSMDFLAVKAVDGVF